MLVRLRSQGYDRNNKQQFQRRRNNPEPVRAATLGRDRDDPSPDEGEQEKIRDHHRAADRASDSHRRRNRREQQQRSASAVITAVTPCIPAIVGTVHVIAIKEFLRQSKIFAK